MINLHNNNNTDMAFIHIKLGLQIYFNTLYRTNWKTRIGSEEQFFFSESLEF